MTTHPIPLRHSADAGASWAILLAVLATILLGVSG